MILIFGIIVLFRKGYLKNYECVCRLFRRDFDMRSLGIKFEVY